LLLDKPFDECDPAKRQLRLEELYNRILIRTKRSDENLGINDAKTGRKVSIIVVFNSRPPTYKTLADLAIYSYSERYTGENSLGNCKAPSHIFSMSEDAFLFLTAHETKPDKLITHNRDFLMHIYPKGLRIDSGNPDPGLCWRFGVQMVAMNWQKSDEPMMLRDAMFAGTNGWVLKPRSPLGGDFATKTAGGEASSSPPAPDDTFDLRITVLAAQSLPFPGGGGVIHRMTNRFGITIGRSFQPKVKVDVLVSEQDNNRIIIPFARKTAAAPGKDLDWGRKATGVEMLGLTEVMEELKVVW
jgi:hypothetical protein